MADASASAFTKLVPGFDFLQGLVKNAGSALPSIGQWVAPTLNPEELEKRIEELRTVQFWLEQNARMLGATIQALEVQRMTLSTLKTMNVQMDDLRESLTIRVPGASGGSAATDAPPQPPTPPGSRTAGTPTGTKTGDDGPAPVDPMQWWGALTKQFTELAASAMRDGGAEAAGKLAETMVKQGAGMARAPAKKAAPAPAAPRKAATARKAAGAARKRGKSA
jgi:hypothetical protein